jgi:serine/threonine-protein kinase HipA
MESRSQCLPAIAIDAAGVGRAHARIEALLWGLLPDNDRVLENRGRRFQVSPRNVFRLITHVGEDCAGAVQFVRPERLEPLQKHPASREIKWLTEDEVAERLKAEWDGHAENEHFSLRLARSAGLIVPNSTVQHFGDEIAMVVERYDLVRSGGRWSRIHQEDMCQAVSLHPANKYESEGGPGVRMIAELLREQASHPEEDVQSLVDAIAFNWLIAGTEAHAKNYALLLGGNWRKWSGTTYSALRSRKYSAVQDVGSGNSGTLCNRGQGLL